MSADMTRPFHMLVKPNGPICNLGCAYCYYLEKTELYPQSALISDVRRNLGGVHPSIY